MIFYPYIFLIISWLFFGVTHSILAAENVKRAMMLKMKANDKYYRLLYSLFATATLVLIFYYHFSCPWFLLWAPSMVQVVIAEILIVMALTVMLIFARKYFMDLSGLNEALGTTKKYPLQVTGMNAYVRHPLYSGTLLLAWALFFRYPYLNNLVSCGCITVYTCVGTYFEEKKLVKEYGEEYKRYQKATSALIPLGMIRTYIQY